MVGRELHRFVRQARRMPPRWGVRVNGILYMSDTDIKEMASTPKGVAYMEKHDYSPMKWRVRNEVKQ